jgi:hypothetical protein
MRLFIAQAILNKSDEELSIEFNKLINCIRNMRDTSIDDIEIFPISNGCDDSLLTLGNSIMDLATVDCAIFGEGWRKCNKTLIEFDVCVKYSIPIIDYEALTNCYTSYLMALETIE